MNSLGSIPSAPTSRDDVVSVVEGARRMGMGRSAFKAWCVEHRILRTVAGRTRIIWGDALDVLRGVIATPAPDPVVQSRDRLPRASLTPRRLPGSKHGPVRS